MTFFLVLVGCLLSLFLIYTVMIRGVTKCWINTSTMGDAFIVLFGVSSWTLFLLLALEVL